MRKEIAFEAFGVKIGIETNDDAVCSEITEHLEVLLPVAKQTCRFAEAEHQFGFIRAPNDGAYVMSLNGEELGENIFKKGALNYFYSRVRLTVAEFAKNLVFLHAGAVSWKNQGIILPANSHGGKTTLVKEFIKNGAVYYSDEFAVLDGRGWLHPFPKTLSVRGIIDDNEQVEQSAESFGATVGTDPVPVKMLLITEFEAGAKWQPETLPIGQGILEVIPHTIPIRFKPEFSLEVLNRTLNHAIIAKSKRGEAESFVKTLLKTIDTQT